MPKQRLSFKQRFLQQVSLLAMHCASDGATHRHHISQALHDALAEIDAELRRPRTNWRLIAALCGVKSFISGKGKRADGGQDHFWSKLNGEDGPYCVLDNLAHEAAFHAQVVPAGGTEYTATANGISKRELDISGSSPTLTLMRKERDWIAEHHSKHPTPQILTDFPKGTKLIEHSVAHGVNEVEVYAGNDRPGWPVSILSPRAKNSYACDGTLPVFANEDEAKRFVSVHKRGHYFVLPE